MFNRDCKEAIDKAIKLNKVNGRNYYVIQNGRSFIVGDRKVLRSLNTHGKKILEKYKVGADFDYRRAIIFTANEKVVGK